MAENVVKQPELVQLKTPPAAQTREDLRRLLVEMIRRNEAERKAKLR
jgi:hypothetical protein